MPIDRQQCSDCGFELRRNFWNELVCGHCFGVTLTEKQFSQSDLEYLRVRVLELVEDGKEWFGYEVDVVEWTDPAYSHQN